jgi:hypothetical protein
LLPVGRILRGDHAGIAVSIPFDLFSGWKVSKLLISTVELLGFAN